MNELVLIFTYSDSWFSRIVCWLTGSRWSHVAIGVNRAGAFNGWHAFSGAIDGVIDARPDDGVQPPRTLAGFLKARPVHEAYALALPNPEAASSFLIAQEFAPYDRWGLLWFLLPWRDWQDPEAWYCFELAAATLRAGFVDKALLDLRFHKAGGVSGAELLDFCKDYGHAVTL